LREVKIFVGETFRFPFIRWKAKAFRYLSMRLGQEFNSCPNNEGGDELRPYAD
jgi:hypothetical protein